jgi:peroxiredoxin
MKSIRRTLLLVTAGVVIAGVAVAVILSAHPGASPALPAAAAAPAATADPTLQAAPAMSAGPAASGTPAAGSTAPAALIAAADALGFRQTTSADVGVVENLPADTPLLAASKSVLPVGASAPDFTLTTATGERVRLSDYRGKTVLLEFFATWCPHCQAEVRHLDSLFQSLPKTDFAILSVNADSEDPASLYAFDRFFHLAWPALLDQGTPAGSFKRAGGAGPVTRAYGVGLYPTFYVIDGNGRVAWRNDREQPDMLLSQKLHDAAGK